jgi:hypothetical protein
MSAKTDLTAYGSSRRSLEALQVRDIGEGSDEMFEGKLHAVDGRLAVQYGTVGSCGTIHLG